MTVEFWVGVLGTAASLAGAAIAWREARRAAGAAGRAEHVSLRLFQHAEARDVAELQSYCRRAQNAMAKYGPANRGRTAAGADLTADALEVQALVLHVGENGAGLEARYQIPAAKFCEEIRARLKEFSSARGQRQLEIGGSILFTVNMFSGALGRVVAQQRSDAAADRGR